MVTVASRRYVRSVPQELNEDTALLLSAAAAKGGHFVASDFIASGGGGGGATWTAERLDTALAPMLQSGMIWIDDDVERGERTYWVMSLAL